ncbi:hypothetical protein [Haloterrigena alkaliphila]|uniref:Uncharacterized protein n=1 Tax=Haloterrigena alkaliphila TaxID=2816475 RepID=A0A8A2VBY5_9EURY|nr:hypothetical protein [Haloterrigena alkaliphila]QSW98230.1 hypothetical protein J0X25_12550 [Haloterrigena alkaliphila]
MLIILCIIVAGGFLSEKFLLDWQQAWAVLAGLLGASYFFTLIGGKVIPLDPIRLFTPLLPVILTAAIAVLYFRQIKVPQEQTIAIILVVLLIATQIAAIPPQLVKNDQTDMVYGESHYTPSEFAIGNWVTTYGEEEVIAEQPLLWHASDYSSIVERGVTNECRGYSIEREHYAGTKQWIRPPEQEVIYNSGGISVGGCPSTI